MVVVGLTGIMGSGKSSVAKVLGGLGVPHYHSDARAKELMSLDSIRNKIVELLGREAYSDGGELNRGYVAEQIFGDQTKKIALEAIVHSALREDMLGWIEANAGERYVVIESAILYGSIIEQDMDYVVAVVGLQSEIIERVVSRDGHSVEAIEARLAVQMSQEELQGRANYTLFTACNEPLIPKVLMLHQWCCNLQT